MDAKSPASLTDTQLFGVIFRRKGNDFNLMNVYALPDELAMMNQRFVELIKTYGSKSS